MCVRVRLRSLMRKISRVEESKKGIALNPTASRITMCVCVCVCLGRCLFCFHVNCIIFILCYYCYYHYVCIIYRIFTRRCVFNTAHLSTTHTQLLNDELEAHKNLFYNSCIHMRRPCYCYCCVYILFSSILFFIIYFIFFILFYFSFVRSLKLCILRSNFSSEFY